jgi:hypothetical protein
MKNKSLVLIIKSLFFFVLFFAYFWCSPICQASETDWGVISIEQQVTYNFSATDITKNFTDQYTFSISGDGSAGYSVDVFFDFCKHGCGNPDVSYGIYDLNGGLISDTGSATLSSGDYVFMVKGTGMGAGNSLDYNGSMTFNSFVSAAPEPSDFFLSITGISCLIQMVRSRRIFRRQIQKPITC